MATLVLAWQYKSFDGDSAMRYFLESILEKIDAVVWVIAVLALPVGTCYLIVRENGCGHPIYHPGKEAMRSFKNDYPTCRDLEVLSETPIDYDNDNYRSSTVMLNNCRKKYKYNCWLSAPINAEDIPDYGCSEDIMYGVQQNISKLQGHIQWAVKQKQ